MVVNEPPFTLRRSASATACLELEGPGTDITDTLAFCKYRLRFEPNQRILIQIVCVLKSHRVPSGRSTVRLPLRSDYADGLAKS